MTVPKSKYERDRIHTITDADFWSAWRPNDPELAGIINVGLASSKTAWKKLAAYLRDCTETEWQAVRDEAGARMNAIPPDSPDAGRPDDILKGRITGWHDRVMNFGKTIDFNANFGESGQYGFHYMRWLTPLVDRFIVMRRRNDLDQCVDIVRQYYAQRNDIDWRIKGLDPVYYELGARAKIGVFLPLFLAMIHTGDPDAGDIAIFMKLFLGFGRSLFRLQRSGYRAGNWQIVGVTGLFRMGSVFHELKESKKWRATALNIIGMHLDQDFYSDGCHSERCWGYGWMSLDGVITFYETGLRSGFLPESEKSKFLKIIRRALRWFIKTITPSDINPAYGDGDLTHADAVLNAAKTYIPNEARADRSVFMKPSGYAIMRADNSKDSLYLNVNFGRFGGWHTHDDLLDFNLWAYGEPIVEEVGRFDSYDQPLNPFFRSAVAHNQLVIDHHPIDRAHAVGQDPVWYSNESIDYFSAWHNGYRHFRNSAQKVARIRRHILFVKPEYIVIYDLVEPINEMIFTVSSYLHAVRPFKKTGMGTAIITGQPSARVAFAHPNDLKRLETGVDIAGGEVTAKRLYPERHYLRARKWAKNGYRGNVRFCMVIYPYNKGGTPDVAITPVSLKNGEAGVAEAYRITTPSGHDTVVFNPYLKEGLSRSGRRVSGRVYFQRGRTRITVE